MAGKLKYLVFLIILIPLSLGMTASRPYSQPANAIDLTGPATCPSTGCAGGQRLNMRADFDLSIFDPAVNPDITNVQVCVYTPINWSVTSLEIAAKGGVTGQKYNNADASNCEDAPPNYTLPGGAAAHITANSFADSLTFAFRLGASATTSGSVLVRVRELNTSDVWVRTGQTLKSVPVMSKATVVYVANDAAACNINFPCYVNSADDLAGGVGTGLKDAIDTSLTTITIKVLGNYTLKTNTILVDKPDLITGLNDANLTYDGVDCSHPMLQITSGATLRSLAVSSGVCSGTGTGPFRTLVQVNSTSPVMIESNDLTQGQDAVQVGPSNTSSLTVRYNFIENNAGYGISLNPLNTGILDAVANNIFGNRSGAQVECSDVSKGTVDHNFWGPSVSIANATSHCTFTEAKRLGAPILRNSGNPGVSSQRVTVTDTLVYAFNNNAIGFQLSGGTTSTMDLFIVNHGGGTPANVPFPGEQNNIPSPCSNFWDVFRADNTTLDPASVLNLHFNYGYINSSCTSSINTTQYCKAANDPNNQLWWYSIDTTTWANTGQNPGGQPTTCDSSLDEMVVSINSNTTGNRPNFNDLSRLPFVVGLPNNLSYGFSAGPTVSPGSTLAILNWTTSFENNISGFYIQRSTSSDTGFIRVSDLIRPLGNSTTGHSYSYTDPPDANHPNLVNNTTYFYRVEIVGLNGESRETGTVSVMPFPSTATPTLTPTITRTPAPTSTPTRTRTLYPTTIYYYLSPTPTRTLTITPTSPFQTITSTELPSPTQMGTRMQPSPSPDSSYPATTPTPEAATQLADVRATRTAIALLSVTPTPTKTKTAGGITTLSLTTVLTILAGLAAVIGGAIYLLRNRFKLPA
jgi:hypothetical protein